MLDGGGVVHQLLGLRLRYSAGPKAWLTDRAQSATKHLKNRDKKTHKKNAKHRQKKLFHFFRPFLHWPPM